MTKTYVSLDLETTGLEPSRDAIIEIGALRFQGDHEIESFLTFVNPGRSIPPFITELTGINDAHVANAPSIRQAARELRQFVREDTVIGHNIGFDLAFLSQHGALMGQHSIDTFELASILVPHAGRYSLANLVRELGIDLPEQTHRALDDARMAHALFVTLLERAGQLPREILEEITRLGSHTPWGPVDFFRDALYGRQRQSFSGGIGAQLAAARGGDSAKPLFLSEELPDTLEPRDTLTPLDVDRLMGLLEEGGALTAAFAEYEHRPQQLEMLQAVAEAFNAGRHLIIEAGTGTGKSVAYLVPALTWAAQNGQRVVISTNTINLQEQLADKDLPTLAAGGLPFEFRAAILKGRSHYLCRRQLEALRRRGPVDSDEARVLAKILLWLPNTLDGDGDALFLPTAAENRVWQTLAATSENCDIDNCPFFLEDGCFFYRARDRAEGSHLVIVNHALLLADIATQNRVLPEYAHLIIDEAHHLERATTEALHFQVDRFVLRRIFDELLKGQRDFPGLLDALRQLAGGLSRKLSIPLLDALIRLEDAADRSSRGLESYFDSLETFLHENITQQNAYSARLRMTEQLRAQPGWEGVISSWKRVETLFATLVEALKQFADGLAELSMAEALPDADTADALQARLVGVSRWLGEIYGQIRAFMQEPTENIIYWIEESHYRYDVLSLHAAPLRIGPLVREHLLEKKRVVILTSATLRVDGSFDYMRERWEAWDALEQAVGSPFDYTSAALVCMVKDVPEPGKPGHQQAVERTLLELFKATGGRALALFTSYAQLKATSNALTGALAQHNITVYSQGSGSSRAQLLENFRKGERAVLLGTRSFWEGVDVPGEALSCLVITKLPFDVPDDPLVAARAEVYEDPFNEYMVPEAILRFLQGFGRLIRTHTDQGIVVVLDPRLLTRGYGQRFIDSLPDPTTRIIGKAALPDVAARWLAGKPLPVETEDEAGGDGWYPDPPWDLEPPESPPWD